MHRIRLTSILYTPALTGLALITLIGCDTGKKPTRPQTAKPTPEPQQPPPPEPLKVTLTPTEARLNGQPLKATAANLSNALQTQLSALPPTTTTHLTVHSEVPYQVFAIAWSTLHKAERLPILVTADPNENASPPDDTTNTTNHETQGDTQHTSTAAYPLPTLETDGWGVGLSVGLGRRGVLVAMNGAPLPPMPGCPPRSPTICNATTEQLDFERLRTLAARIKARYPQTQRVTLVAEPQVPFGAVSRAGHILKGSAQAPLFPEIAYGALE